MNMRAVILAIMFATVAVGIGRAQQINDLENQVALQLGQLQLAIAKGNAVIRDLQKKNEDLKKKCGKPCEDVKPVPTTTPNPTTPPSTTGPAE